MHRFLTKIILAVIISVPFPGYAQKPTAGFEHVEPPFWWTKMKSPLVQIMFYDKDIDLSGYSVTASSTDAVIKDVVHPENAHYVFVTLSLSSTARSGNVDLKFTSGKKTIDYQYTLKEKEGLKTGSRDSMQRMSCT